MNNIYNKKNGFSLVELLVVIVILGLLSGIGIIGVNQYFKKARIKYYSSQEKLIELAGKEYFTDNKNVLPRDIGKSNKVILSKLVSSEYIDEVKGYNKKVCKLDDSYVKAKKESTANYSYEVYLNCPDDSYNNYESLKNKDTSIIINLVSGLDPKAKVTINESNGVASYSYIIYKNGEEVKNSGNINNSSKSTVVNFEAKFKGLGDGKFSIKVISIDEYGYETAETSSDNVKIDTTGPNCGDIIGASTTWTKNDRKITIKCSDDLSDCEKSSYSKTFSTTTKVGKITLADKSGNKTVCKVDAYVDKDKPTCGDITGQSTSWTKNNRTIKLKCNDKGSGCVKNSYENTFGDSLKVGNISISDNAGNTTSCPVNVYIDKTNPTISLSLNSTTSSYNSSNVNYKITASDSLSGIDKYCFNKLNDSDCTPNTTSSSGNNINIGLSYNGTGVSRKACVIDKVGNKSCTSVSYTPYKYCSSIVDSGGWSDSTSCTASCGSSGTKTQTKGQVDKYFTSHSCGSVTQTVACNRHDCCSSTYDSYGSWGSFGGCSASCDGGTQTRYRTVTKKSSFNNQVCSSKTESESQSCNTQSCCSDDNPTGCNVLHSCRSGLTAFYDYADWGSYQAYINDSAKLYELGRVDGFIRVYAESIEQSAWAWGGDEHIGYVPDYCIGSWGQSCTFDQCPDPS